MANHVVLNISNKDSFNTNYICWIFRHKSGAASLEKKEVHTVYHYFRLLAYEKLEVTYV